MLRKFCLAPVALLALLSASRIANAEDDLAKALEACSAALVPSELTTSHGDNQVESFHDAMCGNWYAKYKDTVDAAVGAQAIIEAIPVGGKATYNKQTSGLSRTDYCSKTDHGMSRVARDSLWTRFVPKEGRTAWTTCVEEVNRTFRDVSKPQPIRVRVDLVAGLPVVSIRYDPTYGPPAPQGTRLSTTGMVCPAKKPGRPLVLTTSGEKIPCAWASDDADVGSAFVESSNRGSAAAVISRALPAYITVNEELHVPVATPTPSCTPWQDATPMPYWTPQANSCPVTSNDSVWCMGRYELTLLAKSGGTFVKPSMTCVGLGCDWSRWNSPPPYYTEEGKSAISGTIRVGSNGGKIQFCANEVVYVDSTTPQNQAPREFPKGGTFVVEAVGVGASVVLNVAKKNGSMSALRAGSSDATLGLVGEISSGNTRKWTYRVK